MSDLLYMAWRYLRFNWGKTSILTASIALIIFLPLSLQVVVRQGSEMLTERAEKTPLLLGNKGSVLDLTLSALYFRKPSVEPLAFQVVNDINNSELATALPLNLQYEAGGRRIVGTTIEYFDFRNLPLAKGRQMTILGECVLGSRTANALNADVGDAIISTPAGAFDVAGTFPLKMTVVGILAPAGTPDDEVIFTDIKTTWIIAGLAHGHEDITAAQDTSLILTRQEDNVVANASVLSYTEITSENIGAFHFHGDPDGFPADAIIAVPKDFKSGVLLRGRYEDTEADAQVVIPLQVIGEMLKTVFSVRDLVILGSLGVGLATIAIAVLVFILSIRLRRREIETIRKIGGPRRQIIAILGAEILIVIVAAAALAGGLTLLVSQFGSLLLQLVSG